MTHPSPLPARRVLVPGGTGGVGEGIVRAHLAAGADVVVPTRTSAREAEFADLVGDGYAGRLHLFTHDYTSFDGAEKLIETMVDRLGGIDDVIAPIGGWWAGGPLSTISSDDWRAAFIELSTTHMAVARAAFPRLSERASYAVVVGQSAEFPVPGSGLVSMQQAAALMMQRVLSAEAGASTRVVSLILGPVRTRFTTGEPTWISSDEIGEVTVALSRATSLYDDSLSLSTSADASVVLERLLSTSA